MARRRKGRSGKLQSSNRRPLGRRLLSVPGWRGVAVVLILALAAGAGAWWMLRAHGDHLKRAAIVDQLSTTAPDAAFVSSATQTLTRAGYAVDYISGKQVTVDFFRHLGERGYDLIVLRAHSGLTTITNADTGQVTHTRSASIFTSEPFDPSKYQAERNAGRLGRSRLLEDGQQVLGVFGIEPDFVRYSMRGGFHHTLVVLMGCNGLDAPLMAQAFIDRGASAVVGWDNFVSAPFTDKATLSFLDTLLMRRTSLDKAVRQVSTQFGPDPEFGGRLQLVTSAGALPIDSTGGSEPTASPAAGTSGSGAAAPR